MATATARAGAVRARPRRSTARPKSRAALRAQGGAVALPRRGATGIGALGRSAIRLPDTPLVSLIARSRLWIGLLAVLLFGIVALNVVVMQLNTNIGSMVERSRTLSQQNGQLRAELAKLSSPDRIIQSAYAKGMSTPPAGSIKYLKRYPKPTSAKLRAAGRAASFGVAD